jgi:aminoacrylate hydrolase
MAEACWHEVLGHPLAPTVLLSSGLGGSGGFWRLQVPSLLEAGYRVIVYDQRGTGRSPAQLDTPYSIEDMAQDVLQLLDATSTRRAFVVGHALGGLVGLTLALQAPQRVAGLGLINAWAAPNPHSARCFDARLALLDASGPAAYVQAQPIFLYPGDWCIEHHAQVEAELEHALAHFPPVSNVKARIGALLRFNVADQLGAIRCPAWIAVAQDDVLVPWRSSKFLANALPAATMDLMLFGGHGHCITQADEFNHQMLRFLNLHTESPTRVDTLD